MTFERVKRGSRPLRDYDATPPVSADAIPDTMPDAHTHDEHLRGVDLLSKPAVRKTGTSVLELLHGEYGEDRDGTAVVPASE